MRAEDASRPRPGGQRATGVVMMAAGAVVVILSMTINGDDQPAPPPADDAVEVLGRVLDRPGSPDVSVDGSGLGSPAAVPGAVTPPTETIASHPLPALSPPSPTTTAARPVRATTNTTTTSTTTVLADGVRNQPIDLRVEINPAAPSTGDRLTITVTAIDADAALQPPLVCVTSDGGLTTMGFAGGDAAAPSCAEPERCGDRGSDGELGTPVYSEGRWSMGLEVSGPGTYTVHVFIASGPSGCPPDPYASEAEITRTVLVSG